MKAQFHCGYLYGDGHAVVVYKKRDKHAGEVQWAEIFERFGPPDLCCSFTGRIVVGSGPALFDLCRRAQIIRAEEPTINRGSDCTRKAGIRVGSIELIMPGYDDGIRFYLMPDVLSGQFTYQPDIIEKFDPETYWWGNCRVHKVHRTKQPQPQPEEAAA